MKFYILILITFILAFTQEIKFYPINHGSFVISIDDVKIAIDPVGKKELYTDFPKLDLILITDIHGDHASKETVTEIKMTRTKILAPQAVVDKITIGEVINNDEMIKYKNINIQAVPMYNLTKDRLKFHTKGRGNGYLISINDKIIYISGDTEDIAEMRILKNIDYAFICMNLPYTMDVEQAASATLEMKPAVVIPYHYRGTDGLSDINKFKSIVNSNDKNIKVKFMKWYD